jgi:hypothetical protein
MGWVLSRVREIRLIFLLLLGGCLFACGCSAFNCAGITNATCPLSPNGCAPQIITVAVSTMNANFTADTRSGQVPLTVQFYDNSFGTPTGWVWDFGDGTSSRERYPKHTYTTPGKFDVNLTVTQNHGDKNGTVWSWAVLTYESTKSQPGFITVTGTAPSKQEVSTRSSALSKVMSGAAPAGYKPLKTASSNKRS